MFPHRYDRKSLRPITGPAVEPVLLSEAKAFLRVDTSDEDDVITLLLTSSRRLCEEFCQRAFITQTWELTLDGFGSCGEDLPFSGTVVLPTSFADGYAELIELSRLPIQAISSIQAYAPDNSASTVDPSVYRLDAAGGRIVLNDGQSWPSNLRSRDAVVVTFVCGYGDDGGTVPDLIRLGITQQVSAMYEDRKCSDLQPGVKTLLTPFVTVAALTRW